MRVGVDEDWYWLRAIYELLDDPAFGFWSQIGIPVFLGAATVFVGIASWRTSVRATAIAEFSEKARVEAESTRLKVEDRRRRIDARHRYLRRFDDSLVSLMQSIGNHLSPLSQWQEEAQRVEEHGYSDNYGNLDYPKSPEIHDLNAHCDAVRLLARGKDVPVAEALGKAMVLMERVEGYQRGVELGSFVATIRDWRRGNITGSDAESRFREFESRQKPAS